MHPHATEGLNPSFSCFLVGYSRFLPLPFDAEGVPTASECTRIGTGTTAALVRFCSVTV